MIIENSKSLKTQGIGKGNLVRLSLGMVDNSGRSGHAKGLQRVIVLGTSLSFGILGAIMGSMQDFLGGNAAFEFSYRTIIGFASGAVIGWSLWRVVRWWIERTNRP